MIIKLLEPTAGRVVFDGHDLSKLGRAELRALRREMQIVFQDPYASLNPRMRVRSIVGEGIEIHRLARGAEKEARIVELLAMVGMTRTRSTVFRTSSRAGSASESGSRARWR